MVRKAVSVICSVSLAFILGACSSSSADNNSTETSLTSVNVEQTEPEESIHEDGEPEVMQTEEKSDVLVVVFSQTGNTMGIAHNLRSLWIDSVHITAALTGSI